MPQMAGVIGGRRKGLERAWVPRLHPRQESDTAVKEVNKCFWVSA